MPKLTARKVETAPPGKYGDGGGLQFVVSPAKARKWVFRYSWQGRAREMGLGPYPEIGLAEAREKTLAARRRVRDGIDPIAERKTDRGVPTFGTLADEVFGDLSQGFRNEKHREQWRTSIVRYCAPIRDTPVDQINTETVLSVLRPHWTRAPETASRLRGRVEKVLNAAKAKGYRSGENPAAWRGHLDHLLPSPKKIGDHGHYIAMAYADVPGFLVNLRERRGVAALALEFAILTAARSGEVLGARWDEIDLAHTLAYLQRFFWRNGLSSLREGRSNGLISGEADGNTDHVGNVVPPLGSVKSCPMCHPSQRPPHGPDKRLSGDSIDVLPQLP